MKTAEERRQEGIARQRAKIAELNAAELAAAKFENGKWVFRLHGQGPSWLKTAKEMIAALATREGVDVRSLAVCVLLPERGRSFQKSAGSEEIVAYG